MGDAGIPTQREEPRDPDSPILAFPTALQATQPSLPGLVVTSPATPTGPPSVEPPSVGPPSVELASIERALTVPAACEAAPPPLSAPETVPEPQAPPPHRSLRVQPVDVQGTQDAWLASVLRSVGIAVVSSSIDGRIRSWNRAAEMLLGFQAEEVLGRPVTMLVAPPDRLATAALLARLYRGEPVGPFETSRLRKDGFTLRVSVLLAATRDRTGRVVGCCAVLREVGGGGWLQAELEALTQEADVVVAVFDQKFRPLSVSASIERVLGTDPDAWVAQQVYPPVHEDDFPAVVSSMRQWVATPGLSAPIRYRIRHGDGSWRWMETFGHNLLDDPDVRGLVMTTWDVTERHEAEHAMAAAESRIQAVFDQGIVPQILLSLDRRILEANAAFCSLMGYDSGELVGRSIDELSHPDDVGLGGPPFDRLMSGEAQSVTFQRHYVRKDGSSVEIRTRTALVRDNDGRPLYATGIGTDMTERNEARRALEHSEARLRAITENSLDVIAVVDPERRMTYVSPSVTRMLGFDTDELLGTDVAEFIHPEDLDAVMARFAETAAARPGTRHDPTVFRGRAADGTWRRLESVATNLMADDAVGGILVNVRDVTERHRATDALAASEARYRTIVDTAQEGIWLADLSDRITFVNPALAGMLRCGVEDLVGRTPTELMGPERRLPPRPGQGTFVADPDEEIRFVAWDGTDVWATVSTSPVVAPTGEAVGSLAMVSDVTDRRRSDLNLRNSEERFRSLVQFASDLAIIATPEGTITYATPGAEVFLGRSASELVGLNVYDWLCEDDLAAVSESLMGVVADNRPVADRVPGLVRCRVRHVDGAWHTVEATLSNLIDVPAVGGIVVNVRDIDDLSAATLEVEASHRRFESLVTHSTDVIMVFDAFGTVSYASPSLEHVLGHAPVDLVGRNTREFVHPDDVPQVERLMASLRRTRAVPAKAEIRVRDAGGGWVDVELVGTNLLDDPAVGGMVFNARDISERVRNEGELRVRAAQQAAVGWLGHRALVVTDLQQLFDEAVEALGANLGVEVATVVEYLSQSGELLVRAVTGVPDAAVGSVWSETEEVGQSAFTMAADEPVLIESLAEETRFRPHDALLRLGMVSSASVVIPGPDGPFGVLLAHNSARRAFTTDDVNFLAAVANVLGSATQRAAYEQRLTYQATYDLLTGLPNRTLLLDRLRLALARRGPGRIVAVLCIGLDRFNLLDEAFSRDLGDEALAAVASRLVSLVRPSDTLARFGGDEFAILSDDLAREEDAAALAQQVLDMVQSPIELSGELITLSANVGIRIASLKHDEDGGPGASGADAEAMVAEADAAMVEAKSRGRGHWELFDNSLRDRVLVRLQLEADLRGAVGNDELALHFQPVVRLDTGALVGVECLLRWDHPVLGHTLPGRFVQVAEETGAILPIGEWTLYEACAQAARWRDQGHDTGLAVSVNLSARQLDEPGLPDLVAGALGAQRLDPSLLCLEITESALMRDASQALSTLESLKGLGVRIAIDDFGTGYSSLAYLRRFPVDVLKIDGSFVQGLGVDAEDSAIVAAVLRLAETLGVDVVAEGVETLRQLDALRALGCPFGQGYHFSRPVPADQIMRLAVPKA